MNPNHEVKNVSSFNIADIMQNILLNSLERF